MTIIEVMVRFVEIGREMARLKEEKEEMCIALLKYYARHGIKSYKFDGVRYTMTHKDAFDRANGYDIERLKADYPNIDFDKYKKVTHCRESIGVTAKLI